VIGLTSFPHDKEFEQTISAIRSIDSTLFTENFPSSHELIRQIRTVVFQLRHRTHNQLSPLVIDCRGIKAPLDLVHIKQQAATRQPNQPLQVIGTGRAFLQDLQDWSLQNHFHLRSYTQKGGETSALLVQAFAPVSPDQTISGFVLKSDTTSSREQLDCRGLTCPMPIVKLAQKAKEMGSGQLEVHADDMAFPADLKVWCERAGATWEWLSPPVDGHYRALLTLSSQNKKPNPVKHQMAVPPPVPVATRQTQPQDVLATFDFRHLQSPLHVVHLQKELSRLKGNGHIIIEANDPQFRHDLFNWSRQVRCAIVSFEDRAQGQRAIVHIERDPESGEFQIEPSGNIPTSLFNTAHFLQGGQAARSVPTLNFPDPFGAEAQAVAERLDYTGLRCPLPILRLTKTSKISSSSRFEVLADDDAFPADIRAWCRQNNFHILSMQESTKPFCALIEKQRKHAPSKPPGTQQPAPRPSGSTSSQISVQPRRTMSAAQPVSTSPTQDTTQPILFDFSGLRCPLPIVKLTKSVKAHPLPAYRLIADDLAFPADLRAWCGQFGMEIKSLTQEQGKIHALIQRTEPLPTQPPSSSGLHTQQPRQKTGRKTQPLRTSSSSGMHPQQYQQQVSRQMELPRTPTRSGMHPQQTSRASSSTIPVPKTGRDSQAISSAQLQLAALKNEATSEYQRLDLRGVKCPMVIVKLSKTYNASPNRNFEVWADDPSFPADIESWCQFHPYAIAQRQEEGRVLRVWLQRQPDNEEGSPNR
jgi:tRNA 2-thiouridine synthesizing protein A